VTLISSDYLFYYSVFIVYVVILIDWFVMLFKIFMSRKQDAVK
jgi:hypothetical protein